MRHIKRQIIRQPVACAGTVARPPGEQRQPVACTGTVVRPTGEQQACQTSSGLCV